jgi:hypothetical protein
VRSGVPASGYAAVYGRSRESLPVVGVGLDYVPTREGDEEEGGS